MNETVAAAAKMLLALLDLDFLAALRGTASSGIVFMVLVMMSVAVNINVANYVWSFMLCFARCPEFHDFSL